MTNALINLPHAKKSEQLFNNLDFVLKAVPIPIITTTQDLTILSVNDATVKMLDIPSESILGAKYPLFFQLSDSQYGECLPFEAMRRFQPMSGEATAYIRGRTIQVEYGAIPVADDQGQITSVVNYLVDRSDRLLFYDEINTLGEQIKLGSLEARADLTNFPEPYRSALAVMNVMLDIRTMPLREIESAAYQIAAGNSPVLLKSFPNGEMGKLISRIVELLISKSPSNVSSSPESDEASHLKIILEMVRLDLHQIGHRLQTGDYGVRMDCKDYEGDFKETVEIFNDGLAYSEKALNTITGFLSHRYEVNDQPLRDCRY
ncbi:MAG: hypothetical protein CVU88_07885 [Firmicutes bacterium HGW-Firmicutes-13]|nr:MAG: hypothetical protein CVU88_07885 [Firmicutes bacterium HGW-Firmicutes-13]